MFIKAEQTEWPRPSSSSPPVHSTPPSSSWHRFTHFGWLTDCLTGWQAGLTSTSVRPALTPAGQPSPDICVVWNKVQGRQSRLEQDENQEITDWLLVVVRGAVRDPPPPTRVVRRLSGAAGGARSHTLTLDSSRLQRAQLSSRHFHVSCL